MIKNKKEKKEELLAPIDLEKQESLSAEILTLLHSDSFEFDDRPTQNFIDLMSWTDKKFSPFLKDEKIYKFVQNRIVMDGQFLQFARENKIKIKCLLNDSIISWNTTLDTEKFFAQGVFLIEGMGCEFIHAALFHKGNNFEDEISFFILCSNENYDNYIKLRNTFDKWILDRDRSNLYIKVVDGEDIQYTKEDSWNELFLPSDIKNDIKNLVEGFLSSKDFYLNNRIPWKRAMLLYGEPGNGKTSIIKSIISNYSFKPVTIIPEAGDEAIRDAFAYAESQSPSLLYFEDIDSMIKSGVNISSFLNLMDGISSKNGLLVIATANNFDELPLSLTDRPSRFDRKIEIPLPNQEMAYIYLSRWFGKLITVKKCKELAKLSEKNGFSYAYLKEIYISSMFEALSSNRKYPTEKDITISFNRLLKDKGMLKCAKKISTEKYFK
jgi:hypothetical protein